MNPPPIKTTVITDRVFLYAVGAVLLVAFTLSALLGVLAFGAMRELAVTREALEQAKAHASTCRDALLRSDARLDQTRELLEIAGSRRRPAPMGGGE